MAPRDTVVRDSAASGDDRTACPGCYKHTRTIWGRCPNCGHAKTMAALAQQERLQRRQRSYFWGELDDLVVWALLLVPGLVLFLALLLVVGVEVFFALAAVLVVMGGLRSLLALLS